MKTIIRTAILAFCCFLQTALLANTFIVKGYIVDNNNKAVAGKTVRIYADTTTQGCIIAHAVVTNPNGYYIDTLTCNGDIRNIKIDVEDCTGKHIVNTPVPTNTSAVIESNFTICTTATTIATNCKAAFSIVTVTPGTSTAITTASGVKFSSTASVAPTGDSIINRTWNFGDSSQVLTGNIIDPTHYYTKAGTYAVCLSIKTKAGCQNQYCYNFTVRDTVPAVSTNCKAVLSYMPATAAGANISTVITTATKIIFSSKGSSAPTGDSIISRTWFFGDSTNTQVNSFITDSTHRYVKAGTYNVCLYIKTRLGCENKYCTTITIHDTTATIPTTCKAVFTYTTIGNTIKLNSSGSLAASSTDSIISRTWYFSDSTNAPVNGNTIDPSHTFAKPGTYTVYLSIKTKAGCESNYYATVTIAAPPTNCKAVLSYTLGGTQSTNITTASVIRFSSRESSAPSGDSIISRTWFFGDSTNTQVNSFATDSTHRYLKAGTYNVCLYIKTRLGCESKYCTTITIHDTVAVIPTSCKAVFDYTISGNTIKLNSSQSLAASSTDSIVSRTWYFSDSINTAAGSTSNIIDPTHTFAKPGTYTVYLLIKTKAGCESKYAANVTIAAPANCKALFTYSIQAATVKFNSIGSAAASSTDSIISRYWLFGDSTSMPTGNPVDPSHTYTKAGTYQVILYIKTLAGCESRYAATIVIANTAFHCEAQAQFDFEKISLKQIQFNSSASKAQSGDSIVHRTWYFGDSTYLTGNEISPAKEFTAAGYYNTCLLINTAKGCESKICKEVTILDSVTTPQSSVDYIKIISINPNPVISTMVVTVWSRNSNAEAEISVYDIYGTSKMTIKKILTQGNNAIEMNVSALFHGPYFIKVATKNGKDSKQLYKL